jgi:hypothetical protein
MAAVPLWMLGKHVTAVQAVLQTVDPVTGALANAGTFGGISPTADFIASSGSSTANPPTIVFSAGLVDSISLRGRKQEEEISSVNETHANHVPIYVGYSLVVVEILRQAAAKSLWANLWTASDPSQNLSRIVAITFARAGNKWSGYLRMARYPEIIRRGKNVARMELVSIDPGQPNLVYSAGDR